MGPRGFRHLAAIAVTRKEPNWLLWSSFEIIASKEELELSGLLTEINQALAGGQHRLAAMGIRSLLEHVIVMNDLAGFGGNLMSFKGRDIFLLFNGAP